MTRLQPTVTQWQGQMQLQRLLCSTNTHVASVLECTLIANATAYAADGEPNASKTFCPETSAPSCPPLVRAVPPLQLLPSHGYNLMPDLWCLVLSPTVHGRADSNLALNSSNPVKMRFLWRCRTHHKFCHCKLILKFFYADCDHVLTNMVFSFFRSHIKLCFYLISAPCIWRNTGDKMFKWFASRHTIYTELLNRIFLLPWAYFPHTFGLTDSWSKLQGL